MFLKHTVCLVEFFFLGGGGWGVVGRGGGCVWVFVGFCVFTG